MVFIFLMIGALSRPIDKAILIYFRICTGILMSQELINSLIIGKYREYTDPQFHFSYQFFEWVKPWPYHGMILQYLVTIFAGFMVAAGIGYRFFAIVLFLGNTSFFLMEMSEYINHHYLYCLLSFWMIFLPLKNDGKSTAPAWALYLILFHMALAYFFGGIAKLNSDWLNGTPMDLFLAARANYPLGFLYSQSWAPLFFSYGGVAFDLLIVPMMIFPRTRKIGLAASVVFHLSNVMMFGLATFPWFSLLLTSMFFDPSWPRKIPYLNQFIAPKKDEAVKPIGPVLAGLLAIYALVHVTLPLRHFVLYPESPNWSEEGHMFSWRMMLRSKSGNVYFTVMSGDKKLIISPKEYLTQRQINDLLGNPEMILQFSHFLRDRFQMEWKMPVEVYASSRVSLNGRPAVEIIKPGTNLAKIERSVKAYDWIMPLNQELLSSSDEGQKR
ncbi:HTTM domain-containing protein [Peredibacter starrii]|uniref:HTTM domain-containing protein n=1 Tax=Peredibacter starrii TaxID=28202 RepID=A0AAX4HN05_9BACT|nr:HTTM domain-containing protein [Peredibacter starrii]WPU64669.1 HTTM domain-containing protein [Peredibacter starrii]